LDHDTDRPYYITTPIYYVNGRPHIGSALTTLCCDVLARYQRMRGRATWFLTGTDEQATKVAEAAREKGVAPSEFVDGLAAEFRAAWSDLGIAYDDFIRTTEDRHVRVVQEVFRRMRASGDAYRGVYEGWYCVSDETFFRESDVGEDRLCPNAECRKPLRRVQEESYFFRLSAYADRLLEHTERNPGFLQPEFRRNEVIAFIRQGLRDMSITRSNDGWGIPVPDEPDKVIYVWFDALINYLAATGWPDDEQRFRRLWPPAAHLMAKEIFVRFHATLWPAMLMSVGLPLPETIYAHGWWVDAEGRKEGKRTGGLPHPTACTDDLVSLTGADRRLCRDALRYLLLREMVFHGDSEFSREAFLRRYNTDLANDLGNLCSRATNMVDRYCGGAVPAGTPDPSIGALASRCAAEAAAALSEFRFNAALEAVWQLVGRMNRYIEDEAPWTLAKRGETERLAGVLTTCLEAIRVCATLIAPVMPFTADELLARVGVPRGERPWRWDDALAWGAIPAGARLPKPEPLFPRIQIAVQESTLPPTEPSAVPTTESNQPSAAVSPEHITIDEFMKVELRVAEVVSAEPVPNATKLLKLTVNLGEQQRTILAGIAEMYEPAELVGKQVVVVANLQPRKMRGIESQGMLLAADADGQAILLHPETPVPPGTRVR